MPDYSSTFAGVRAAIIADGAVGRAVYRSTANDDPRPPCVVIAEATPTPALSGDGGLLEQSRPLDVILLQKNSRDADPTMALRVVTAVHGLRFTVQGRPTRIQAGVVEPIEDEGYYILQFTANAFQPAFTP
jgi:hypothetical protein